MLSIIISSYQPSYYLALEQNIADTIGIPYEVIKVDNPGKMGICEAYNKGAAQAQYDYLLFLHEDVLFETQDWGLILTKLLSIENIGCLGIAGADYIPEVPIGWWMISNHCYSHITHFTDNVSKQFTFASESGLKKVNILDGVFMACPQKNWLEVKFDEKLKGFHAYDVSFSLKLNRKYENFITNLISVKHFSRGKPSRAWMEALILNRKENSIDYQQANIDYELEYDLFTTFSKQLWHLDFSRIDQVYYLFKYISVKKLGIKNYLKSLKKIAALLFYQKK